MSKSILLLSHLFIIAGIINIVIGNEQKVNKELDPDQNELIRQTVNKAAGRELIPKDTVFELKSYTGTSTWSSVVFPDGGSAILSQSSYSSNGSINCTSSLILISLLLSSIIFTFDINYFSYVRP